MESNGSDAVFSDKPISPPETWSFHTAGSHSAGSSQAAVAPSASAGLGLHLCRNETSGAPAGAPAGWTWESRKFWGEKSSHFWNVEIEIYRNCTNQSYRQVCWLFWGTYKRHEKIGKEELHWCGRILFWPWHRDLTISRGWVAWTVWLHWNEALLWSSQQYGAPKKDRKKGIPGNLDDEIVWTWHSCSMLFHIFVGDPFFLSVEQVGPTDVGKRSLVAGVQAQAWRPRSPSALHGSLMGVLKVAVKMVNTKWRSTNINWHWSVSSNMESGFLHGVHDLTQRITSSKRLRHTPMKNTKHKSWLTN